MAISVISDIVMDVVRAADPLDVQTAQAKLKANNAAYAASSLADAGNGFAAAFDRVSSAESRAGLADANMRVKRQEIPDTFRQFEASVLQTFVQNMMPRESEGVYGSGNAGEIYKGMMAEQMAKSIAQSGGIGIAEQAYTDALRKARSEGLTTVSMTEKDDNAALRMVAEYQREVLGVSNDLSKEA